MDIIVLTIGIASYNRPKELERCLESIKSSCQTCVEILICEDKSPRRTEIEKVVNDFCTRNPDLNVVLQLNEENIGYDRNIKKIITMARGDWVMLMSDDDKLYPEAIDATLKVISEKSPAIIYSPFYQMDLSQYKRRYDSSFVIDPGERYISKHVYDSILFSGLTFKKECVNGLDAEPFHNKYYFQVYMFIYTVMNYGGYYMNTLTVEAVGDGENGYGKSDSSEKNPLLADRNSVFSELEFHKGLIWTIKKFDSDYGKHVFQSFEKEYNLRTYGGLSRANVHGKEIYREYWRKLNSLDIRIGIITKIYHVMLIVFGANITNKLMAFPRILILKKRHAKE